MSRLEMVGLATAVVLELAGALGCSGTPTNACKRDSDCDDGSPCTEDICVDIGTADGGDVRGCVHHRSAFVDLDRDGVAAQGCGGTDCDDTDPERHPGAVEVCDLAGKDEDCDPTTFGDRDADGDGFVSSACCNGTHCGRDCDDTQPSVNPNATEACNFRDDDCDSAIDEGVGVTLYPDLDRDGYGRADGGSIFTCAQAFPGLSSLSNDCDDDNPAVGPGSMVCNPIAGGATAVYVCSSLGKWESTKCAQGTCSLQPNGLGICK